MNLTWLSISFVSIACAITLAASVVAVVAARRISSAAKRINSLSSRVESTEVTVSEMTSLLKTLETRDRMRRVRAGSTSSGGSTLNGNDPLPGQPGWKAAMRLKLASGQLRTTNITPKGNDE